MNLPQPDAPPVAVEAAAPGELFFVPQGKTFTRQIGVYDKRARSARALQTWVYGFLSKQVEGQLVPDRSRRGWVPLRVLDPA